MPAPAEPVRGPGCARPPHTSPTRPAQRPYYTAPASAGAARGVSVSVPPPACAYALALRRLHVPGLTPTSKRARSGTLRLCYASKQPGGGPIRKRTGGKPGTPPAPEKPTARFQVSPRPPFPASPTNATHCANDREIHGTGHQYRIAPAGQGNCKALGDPARQSAGTPASVRTSRRKASPDTPKGHPRAQGCP